MRLHPDPHWLAEWLARWSDPDERRRVLHLLRCPGCRERAEAALAGPTAAGRLLPWPTPKYEALLARVVARGRAAGVEISRDQAEAPVLLGELLLLPAAERRGRAAAEPRFASWWLAELAIDRGGELAAAEPGRAAELLDLAGAVLDRLGPPAVGTGLVADLRARWLLAQGELRRLAGDLGGAGEAFAAARAALGAGTGDPCERAVLHERTAALRHAERRFGDAARLAGRAARLFAEAGDFPGVARAALARAAACRAAGRPGPAAEALGQALATAPPAQERRLRLELAFALVEAELARGRGLAARRVFERTRPVSRLFTDEATGRRRVALAGRIDLALGRLDAAEPLLVGAWRLFAEQEPGLDAVLLAAERARLLARQGRGGELAGLAEKLAAIGETAAETENGAAVLAAAAAEALARLRRLLVRPAVDAAALDAFTAWCDRARFDPGLPPPAEEAGETGG